MTIPLFPFSFSIMSCTTDTVQSNTVGSINPIWCGGGRKMPPLSYFCDSPKKINGKSCQFFLTFPKYVNGRLGTTFCSQITFRVVGRGLKWSKLPQFHKGGPCREQQEGKITNQNRCQVIHVAHNFLVIFLLKHLGLGEIWGWEPFFGQKVLGVLRMVGGAFYAPPRPRLSLQTPASDRVNTLSKGITAIIYFWRSLHIPCMGTCSSVTSSKELLSEITKRCKKVGWLTFCHRYFRFLDYQKTLHICRYGKCELWLEIQELTPPRAWGN